LAWTGSGALPQGRDPHFRRLRERRRSFAADDRHSTRRRHASPGELPPRPPRALNRRSICATSAGSLPAARRRLRFRLSADSGRSRDQSLTAGFDAKRVAGVQTSPATAFALSADLLNMIVPSWYIGHILSQIGIYTKMPSRARREQELTPQEIRVIRETLGLSQVEAGELLGGGPRAFAKYENGSTKPSASIVKSLKMLEANPQTLEALTGRKPVSIDSSQSRPGEVIGRHVAALSPTNLSRLARRLLSAEALASGLPMDGIHVAATIAAPDGGEDARIEWKGGPNRTARLPGRLNQFQLKAGSITPGKAGLEVLGSDGRAKPMIRTAIEAGGTYIMMCGESYTRQDIQKRVDQIRRRLAEAGLAVPPAQVQFRDADQIADWVNAHHSVAAWLLEQTQPGLMGPFHDWGHWAAREEHDKSPLVDDPRLPAFMLKLRELVGGPRGVARVVGMSGVGKSRLALEALGPTTEEEALRPRLSDIVLYAVESEAGTAAIKTAVQHLADASMRAVVVVDRCDEETHRDLVAMVKHSASRLSLVTIDDELPGGSGLPVDHVFVEAAADSVIDAMLKRIAPGLPNDDRQRVVKFAGGLPQLAALIGLSWMKDEPIGFATDQALIDRIVLGKKPENAALIQDAAMLVSAFGLIGVRPPADQDLETLARLSPNRTSEELRVGLADLERRRVAQRRGRLLAVKPLPIAIALAEKQWRRWSHSQWDDVLAGSLPDHLRIRAARRLALLNTSPTTAAEVVQYVCRLDGPLATLEGISHPGNADVISSLAEVDTPAVVILIERVLCPLTTEELKNVSGHVRRELVWAIEKISFRADTFDRGAALLLDLAVAENEPWGNNATGQYKALFPVMLGNTAAGPAARLLALDDALKSSDPARLQIAVDAALEGGRIHSFSRTLGVEMHGTRPALAPWQPTVWQEVWDYVQACLERVAKVAARQDAIGDRARTGLGHAFRSLVSAGALDLVEQLIETVTAAHGCYWPPALGSLGDILVYDSSSLSQQAEGRVRKLVSDLTPNELAARVRFLVTEMPWDYPVDEQLDYQERNERQIAALEDLASDLLAQPEILADSLPPLSRGEQRMGFQFGLALAGKAADPLIWRDRIKNAYVAAPPDTGNFGVLAGYFAGLAKSEPGALALFKEESARSPVLAHTLPLICAHVGIQPGDVDLVRGALAGGLLKPFRLMQWCTGGVLAKVPTHVVSPLFDQLFGMGGATFSIVLELMGMYVHGRSEVLDELRPQLRLAGGFPAHTSENRGSQMDVHHFHELMGWILGKGRTDPDAVAIAIDLTKQLIAHAERGGEHPVKRLLPKLLPEFLEVVWPLLGHAIVSDPRNAWRFEFLLGDRLSFGEQNPAALRLPEDMLFAWAHAHPAVAPRFLAVVFPVLVNRNPERGSNSFHPMTKRLIDEFGDREDVLRAITGNMHTFGWSGSREPYFAMYLDPFRGLASHPIGAVRRWAARTIVQLESAMSAARDEEDEQRAAWE
jgi:DNA-binding transcriptional regulator YiaG